MGDAEKKLLRAAVEFVRTQIKKDAANRYSLLDRWDLPMFRCGGICPAFSYDGEFIHVDKVDGGRVRVTVKPYTSTAERPVCDGCSLSPDLRGCIEGAILHDPWYLEMERMSAATGIPAGEIRALGDALFGNIAAAIRGDGFVARTYYWAVRVFGGIFHRAKKPVLVILAGLLLGGCAGCAIPGGFDEPVEPPVFEKAEAAP